MIHQKIYQMKRFRFYFFFVSVEVKIDPKTEHILTGFAQCCSYRFFSDYVYYFCFRPQKEDSGLIAPF